MEPHYVIYRSAYHANLDDIEFENTAKFKLSDMVIGKMQFIYFISFNISSIFFLIY